jgi:hypothetical protein
MGVLDELEQAVREVADRAGPSVVGIGRGRGRGSGVVLADGLVATNAHNLRGEETTVVFAGDRSAVGRVAGVDVDADLAVLAVDTGGAPAIGWAEDAGVRVGTPVFALANPGGQLRVTFGLVSAVGRAFRGPRGRRIAGSIEHTAPLPRGASGGPVVDAAGRLLGIDTNRLGDGFYLALPADADLRQRLDALGRAWGWGSPRPGWPGSCAAPSASPSATACSSGWSRRAARPTGPACAPATCWSRPAAGRSPTPTSCTRSSTGSARGRTSPCGSSGAPTSSR